MNEDLPVTVALPAPLGAQVTAWVEQDLGWQVVDRGGPLAPVLALADEPCGGLPWIAVTDGVPGGDQVRRMLTTGALDVIEWPHDRSRIPVLAAQVDRRPASGSGAARLTVAGAAGGAGTSTVALAIGGLLAWSGASTLVSGDAAVVDLATSGTAHDVPATPEMVGAGAGRPSVAGEPPVPTGAPVHQWEGGAALTASMPVPVAGVAGLSVVDHAAADLAATAWTGDVVVIDAGTTLDATTTLVVSRPDRGLRRAAASGRPVVLVGDRPLAVRDCRRLLGRALVAYLPLSARVARAGLHGRVPAALPGAWLSNLRAGLSRLERWSR